MTVNKPGFREQTKVLFRTKCNETTTTIQSVPQKSDTIENVQIFGQSENVLKCLTVNTISLNSQVCNYTRLRAV